MKIWMIVKSDSAVREFAPHELKILNRAAIILHKHHVVTEQE